MKQTKIITLIITLLVVLSSTMCTLSAQPGQEKTPEVDLAATNEALKATLAVLEKITPAPEQTAIPEATPFPKNSGTIEGQLCYPSEFIPPMRVFAFNIETNEYYFVETERNQTTYQIQGVPEGTYHVVTFTIPAGSIPHIGGAYSAAVLCGLTTECKDHTLALVEVKAGKTTIGINPADFVGSQDSLPIDPFNH
jgi:hypothetical protein